MTDREKALAYDKALERAKRINSGEVVPAEAGTTICEYIFPELKESEDERIRKTLKQGFIRYSKAFTTFGGVDVDDILAWLEKQGQVKESEISQHENKTCKENADSLTQDEKINEKQGEQKPADKAEPKFHEGDWVVYNHNPDLLPRKIIQITNEHYVFDDGSFKIKTLEADWHLWTIDDAKDGDVLYEDFMEGFTFIYNGVNEEGAILYSFIINNEGKDVLPYNIGKPNTGLGFIEEHKSDIKPATKEQRDILFAKMNEAGYEWDSEKKELKKIEQKSAEWSDEDEENRKSIIGFLEGWLNTFKETDYAEDCKRGVKWLKSLPQNWKPSDKQMRALSNAIQRNDCEDVYLIALYNKLTKLKQ